jgi:putative oxidoreductase
MNTAAVTKRASEQMMSTPVVVISWILRLIAAVILLQTLYFKFTGAPESVYIFTKVHAEPWGRYGSGVVELTAAVLLLWPRFSWAGATLALGVMSGAIVSHLTLLGVEVQGDHGLLFGLALTVFVCSAILIFIHRTQLPVVGEFFQ